MSRQSRTNDISPNGKTSGKGLKSVTRPASKKTRGRLRLAAHTKAATTLVDDSDEDNNSEGAKDEQTTDDNEDDVIAPSGRSNHKRGHQTGLSVSLSNTTIAGGNRKRTWSNRIQEGDDMQRPVKMVREEILSSQEDDDSDAGYDGVDLISESEDEDTEREEEELIIQSEEEVDDDNDNDDEEETRPNTSSSSASWEGFEDNGVAVPESSFFTEHFERTDAVQENLTKAARKVRFLDEVTGMVASSSDSSDSEDDFFPDLMIQQDQLDPRFRAILEKDSDSEGSYWDLGYGDSAVNDESEEDGSSSGYESDEGETTDEEILPPPTIRPQSSQNTNAKSPSRTPQRPVRRSSATPASSAGRQGPSLASWTVDPAKPYAIVDKSGSNMIFYPAQRPQNKAVSASRTNSTSASPTRGFAAASAYAGELDKSEDADQHLFLQSPATLMMSGFSTSSASQRFGSHVVGPPEAFFPWRSVDANGNVTYDDEDYDDDDDDDLDMEENLNIDDFIDFGDSSGSDCADEDIEEEAEEEQSPSEQIMPHHATAFRRNQLRVMSRQPRTFKADAIVKTGRLDLANQPISPIRKQKPRKALGVAVSRRIATASTA